jgi:hypothetical protein
MKTSKKIAIVALAAVLGFGAAVTTALAAGDALVSLCYRNRTIQVPSYLVGTYTAKGATPIAGSPCEVTGP